MRTPKDASPPQKQAQRPPMHAHVTHHPPKGPTPPQARPERNGSARQREESSRTGNGKAREGWLLSCLLKKVSFLPSHPPPITPYGGGGRGLNFF